jgi:hypothetical protein
MVMLRRIQGRIFRTSVASAVRGKQKGGQILEGMEHNSRFHSGCVSGYYLSGAQLAFRNIQRKRLPCQRTHATVFNGNDRLRQ